MNQKLSDYIFPSPFFISKTSELKEILAVFSKEKFVTIDTEFIRENHYWPQLCLLQMAGENNVVLVDALSPDIDLSVIAEFLKTPDVIKVFHAAGQDLEIFYKLFGFLPDNLFDTQIAAMVAGFGEQVGYDNLVMSLLGVGINKVYRFSDWSARPLSVEQINYAAADVTYLRPVYEKLKTLLEKDNRLDWIDTELLHLSKPESFLADPQEMWKRIRIKTRDRKTLTILQALAAWREGKAQALNVPRQRVIKDDSLVEIAQTKPETQQKLERIRGISKEIAFGNFGKDILKIIEEAASFSDKQLVKLPEKKDQPKSVVNLYSLLKLLLTLRCEEFKVAPRLVATTEDLDKLITFGEQADTPVLSGWRRSIFGEQAIALCQGKLALTVKQKRVEMIRTDN